MIRIPARTFALALLLAAPAAQAQPVPIPQDAPATGPIVEDDDMPSEANAARNAQGAHPAMVSTANPLATEAGLEVLKAGGSAVDASIAVMLALTVVEPQSSGIGGGGFLLYQPAKGPLFTVDGRETAPGVASPAQFLGPDGKPLPFPVAATGGRSVGVPGNVRLAAEAHRRYGRLPWARLFQPAIRLAEGFTVSPALARFTGLGKDGLSKAGPAGRALYLPDGKPLTAGTRFANPALAATLRTLATRGPNAFYTGAIARGIAETVSRAEANPTAMTTADIAAYRAQVRAPVCGRYRVWTVCGMAPPSSGGVGVLQMLKQLERFDMAGLGKESPVAWHLFAESQRLAYADRDKWVGDPGFVSVPVAGLTDATYIANRGGQISATARIAEARAGMPQGAPPREAANDNEVPGTTSFAVADGRGGVATWTSTVERTFGSGLVSGGFVLNNELTDFNFAPADQGGLTANRVQPGKRPRSSMSPTIVYDADGQPVLAIGAAGGTTIVAQVAKAIIGVLDWKLPVDQAIALPTLVAIGNRMSIEDGLKPMLPALTALGHKPQLIPPFGKLNGVERVAGGWRGGADPRSEGVAKGQ